MRRSEEHYSGNRLSLRVWRRLRTDLTSLFLSSVSETTRRGPNSGLIFANRNVRRYSERGCAFWITGDAEANCSGRYIGTANDKMISDHCWGRGSGNRYVVCMSMISSCPPP